MAKQTANTKSKGKAPAVVDIFKDMPIVVEDIPVTGGQRTRGKYPFSTLEVGQSFCCGENGRRALTIAKKKNPGKVFAWERTDDAGQYRIGRIE